MYLHRVARAGRFGTKGLAITFVSDEKDVQILNQVQERFVVNITELPDEIDISTYSKSTHLIQLNHSSSIPPPADSNHLCLFVISSRAQVEEEACELNYQCT